MSGSRWDVPTDKADHRPAGEPPNWVDDELLSGADDEVCLRIGSALRRTELRDLVTEQADKLREAGLRAGGTVTLHLPPSAGYVASLLAAWRVGAQVSLLDHRLTRAEVDKALDRLAPQVVVEAADVISHAMSGYATLTPRPEPRAGGKPAQTPHALIQLSSGSTGPSKVIARTSDDLLAELDRYARLDDYPGAGTQIVLLASIVHVLGLVGGLLHSLHAGIELVFPDRLTADGIRAAVSFTGKPAMILGVPFHAELLTADPRPIPQLTRMVVAGELTRPWVPAAFTSGYGVPLGSMYGMTELGVIATDLSGKLAPAVAPAPGMRLRVSDGELHVAMAASPYIGLVDENRWVDGWLRTRDAATMDPQTGHVTILGRLDSQVSVGGLKVDLTEVEQAICALPAVAACVVSFDSAIEAYLVLRPGSGLAEVEAAMGEQLAAFKRPRRVYVLSELPRTATGKNVRDRTVLRAAADASPAVSP
ncbi:MAG TPA: class I adenylate-forming enzyme family protein [Streptosporangiaceae bacterium]|nr:class I adenylate-forming enzyme family protein [Streptosporangiaceae bacterium]